VFDARGVEAFGRRLREVRKAKGYTQMQLAFEAGMTLFLFIFHPEKFSVTSYFKTKH